FRLENRGRVEVVDPGLHAGEHVGGLVDPELSEDYSELGLQGVEDSRVDGRFHYQVVRDDVVGLADAVDPADSLLDLRGAPRQVVIDDHMGELEVDAFTASVG